MDDRTIIIPFTTPPIRLRLKWWLQDLWLRLTWKPMTKDEWYAADCPPFPGQRRWLTAKDFEASREP